MKKKIIVLLLYIVIFQLVAVVFWYFFDQNVFVASIAGAILTFIVANRKKTAVDEPLSEK
jgi:hypothetical protein